MSTSIAIIGAGFTGCTLAERFASIKCDVVVFEALDAPGGLCSDGYSDTGIFYHHYGPHIFHTNSQEVWRYLSRFTEWMPYVHCVRSHIGDDLYVPVPINRVTTRLMGCSWIEARERLYDNYSEKMWGSYYRELGGAAKERVKPRDSFDCRYFLDRYQGIPQFGYTEMCRRMIEESSRIDVRYSSKVMELEAVARDFDHVFCGGRIDRFIEGVPLNFRTMEHDVGGYEMGLLYPVVNYPGSEDIIRATDYARLLGQQGPLTMVGHEIPRDAGAYDDLPGYPLRTEANLTVFNAYVAALPRNVIPVGRAGALLYVDMGDAVESALKLFSTY